MAQASLWRNKVSLLQLPKGPDVYQQRECLYDYKSLSTISKISGWLQAPQMHVRDEICKRHYLDTVDSMDEEKFKKRHPPTMNVCCQKMS